jgi:hypothetical protein
MPRQIRQHRDRAIAAENFVFIQICGMHALNRTEAAYVPV